MSNHIKLMKNLSNRKHKIITGITLIALMSSVSSARAQLAAKGGYTTGAYSELDAGDTYLDRLSDWFATVGKSREEKAIIKSRRRAVRRIKDTQKSVARKKKEIEKKKKKAMRKLKQRKSDENNK
jgi:hypothetical protein